MSTTHDPVNHPKHYTSHPSGVECITVTEHMGFNVGNAIKYLWRADLKGGVEDLRKAAWYVDREVNKRAASGAGENTKAGVAELDQQRSSNPQDVGSSPTASTPSPSASAALPSRERLARVLYDAVNAHGYECNGWDRAIEGVYCVEADAALALIAPAIERVTAERDSWQAMYEGRVSMLDAAREQASTLKAEVERLRAENDRLESERKLLRATLFDNAVVAEEDVARLERFADDACASADIWREQIRASHEEVERLRAENAEMGAAEDLLMNRAEQAEAERDAAVKRGDHAHEGWSAAEREARDLRAKLADAEHQRDEAVKTLEMAPGDLRRENERLRAELAARSGSGDVEACAKEIARDAYGESFADDVRRFTIERITKILSRFFYAAPREQTAAVTAAKDPPLVVRYDAQRLEDGRYGVRRSRIERGDSYREIADFFSSMASAESHAEAMQKAANMCAEDWRAVVADMLRARHAAADGEQHA